MVFNSGGLSFILPRLGQASWGRALRPHDQLYTYVIKIYHIGGRGGVGPKIVRVRPRERFLDPPPRSHSQKSFSRKLPIYMPTNIPPLLPTVRY